MSLDYEALLQEAIDEAKIGFAEGGIPIGSVLATKQGKIVSRGHNRRVQNGDPTAHAETECIRAAGRRRDWSELVLASTLSPCSMCTGTSLLFRIPTVVIGENKTFMGAEDWFEKNGVELIHLDNAECKELMANFIYGNADLWNEDIGV